MRSRAIVLCAGDSRRLGRAKALLEVRGKCFLALVVEALRGGGADEICAVVGGAHAPLLRRAAEMISRESGAIAVVESGDLSRGPLGSVQSGIAAPGADKVDAFLVHPVDLPGLTAGDATAILAAARAQPEADAVIPSPDMRRGHPGLLRRSLAERALGLGRGSTLRDLLHAADIRIAYVERPNPWLYFDIDTEEDYRRFLAEGGCSPPH